METDVENGLVDTVGEEERGKLSIDIYLLPCAKQLDVTEQLTPTYLININSKRNNHF